MNESTCAVLTILTDNARRQYGRFASTHEALGVAAEEWDELREAVRANDLNRIRLEAFDLAAVLIRLAEACEEGGAFAVRSTGGVST